MQGKGSRDIFMLFVVKANMNAEAKNKLSDEKYTACNLVFGSRNDSEHNQLDPVGIGPIARNTVETQIGEKAALVCHSCS